MIASLPMYDRAETRDANDRLWALIRKSLLEQGVDAPEALTRGDPAAHWSHADLVLSQTCSLPYRTRLHPHVTLVAAPVCDLDCEPGDYYSVIVRRPGNQGVRAAVNAPDSQSGWAAIQGQAFDPDQIIITGSHRASARAVAEGRADVAAIDALTWRQIELWDSFADRLAIVAGTPTTPALPYVTACANDPEPIRRALAAAFGALGDRDIETLGIKGVVAADKARYMALPIPDPPNA